MTELSWLVDLLVNFKLTKPVKEHVLARIKEIDSARALIQSPTVPPRMVAPPHLQGQSASTIANLSKEDGTQAPMPSVAQARAVEQAPAGQVVASSAAAEAMRIRNEALNSAITGKRQPGQDSPAKFHGKPKL